MAPRLPSPSLRSNLDPKNQQSADQPAPAAPGPVAPARSIRLAVVDPYPLFRLGVVQCLARCQDLVVVGEGASAANARDLARQGDADVLIFDIGIFDGSNEGVRDIAQTSGCCKLAILTALEAPAGAAKALEAGASAYMLKGISGLDLAAAVRSIHSGQAFVSPELACRLLAEARRRARALPYRNKPQTPFSYREQQLLDDFSKRLTNKEIAKRLNLSIGTVKHYATQLFRKMRVRNRVEAILATRNLRGR
jgi:two-component system, NarL family, nitrate/nitrite response regulator NarL